MYQTLKQALSGIREGDSVFIVIAPSTPNVFLEHYHPKPYYVLETKVLEIPKQEGGQYFFDTSFVLLQDRVFVDLNQAKKALIDIFAKETDGVLAVEKVRLVSHQEETEGNLQISKEIHDRSSAARRVR